MPPRRHGHGTLPPDGLGLADNRPHRGDTRTALLEVSHHGLGRGERWLQAESAHVHRARPARGVSHRQLAALRESADLPHLGLDDLGTAPGLGERSRPRLLVIPIDRGRELILVHGQARPPSDEQVTGRRKIGRLNPPEGLDPQGLSQAGAALRLWHEGRGGLVVVVTDRVDPPVVLDADECHLDDGTAQTDTGRSREPGPGAGAVDINPFDRDGLRAELGLAAEAARTSREGLARLVRHIELVQLPAPDLEDDRPRVLVAHFHQRQDLGVGGGVVGEEGFNTGAGLQRVSCTGRAE